MSISTYWRQLQLFADGGGEGSAGGEGSGASSASTVVQPADDGQGRLRELGVPEAVLNKRKERNKARTAAGTSRPAAQQSAAATDDRHPAEDNQGNPAQPPRGALARSLKLIPSSTSRPSR